MNYLLLASALLGAMHMTEGLGFGGGSSCGCGAPAAPPACPPPCPPPAPACPAPAPPPPCPAPSPCGASSASSCPPPIPACAPPPVQNSCSSGCGGGGGGGSSGGCGCVTRRRVKKIRVNRDTEIHETTQIADSTEDDVLCNSADLREIILNNMTNDPEISKVEIHDAAHRKLGGHFAVICTKEEFSYVADSKLYCLDSNAAVSCYAFQL